MPNTQGPTSPNSDNRELTATSVQRRVLHRYTHEIGTWQRTNGYGNEVVLFDGDPEPTTVIASYLIDLDPADQAGDAVNTTTVDVISADVLEAAQAEARIRNLRFPRTLDEQIAAVLKPVLASLAYPASVEQHGAMIDAGLAVLRDVPRDEWPSLGFVFKVLAAAVPFFPTESHNIEVSPTNIVTADAGSDAAPMVAPSSREATDEQVAQLAAKLAEPWQCSSTCTAPESEHCQDCWHCPGTHDEMCGW